MNNLPKPSQPLRLARLRYAIISSLFYHPPEPGTLKQRLEALANTNWTLPGTNESKRFGVSTVERWYYQAKSKDHPVQALLSQKREGAGKHPSVGTSLRSIIDDLHKLHPKWSYQLIYDNAVAVAKKDNIPIPSYATIVRYMKDSGYVRHRVGKRRFEQENEKTPRETRSYEVAYTHALWHCDFHVGSRKVLLTNGKYATPVLFAALDDHSRLLCHAQWYLVENAENFVHGMTQAILKRGLPRKLMSDRGKAMGAAECQQGFDELGIDHDPTLPRSPEQNAKIESYWNHIENRLLAMLEDIPDLTLKLLNEATQAYVEVEYNHKVHSETKQTPIERLMLSQSVGRLSPNQDDLRRAFQRRIERTQRISDGTLTVDGVRFEIPQRFRTMRKLTLRYAVWNLSTVDVVDPRSNQRVCTLLPIDKEANASKLRKAIHPPSDASLPARKTGKIAPLLELTMERYAETGLPPAYVPKDDLACTKVQP